MDLIDRSKPPIVYSRSEVNFLRFASGTTMHHHLSIIIIVCLLLGCHAPMEAAESSKSGSFWKDLWKEATSAELKELLRDAQVGKSDAQIKLGHAYRDGDGVKPNIEKAIELYTLASKEPEGLYALGLLYCNGNGGVQDFAKSKTFLEKASGLGFADASDTLALLARDGIGEIQDLKLSHQWTLKAAAQGKPSAMLRCARQYEKGVVFKPDIRKAFLWCLRAAEAGLPEAQHLAGFWYYKGHGVVSDPVASFAWLHLAAEKNASGAAEARDMVGVTLSHSQVTRAWDIIQYFKQQVLPLDVSAD